MSESNESNHNTSGGSKRKDDVIRIEAEWNPTVPDRITATETRNDGTTSHREFEIALDGYSRYKRASRNDTVADFRRNRARVREINNPTSADTAQQADNERDTSDN